MTAGKKTHGQLIVISGPSGVGKSTVIAELLSTRTDIHFSVSFTTRAPRIGEENGVNYYYVGRAEFERMITDGELLEYTEYVNHYYGTSLKVIREYLDAGIDVLLDIEVEGAAKVKERCPEAVLIFIIPPSFEELSRRLYARNTDGEDVINGRLRQAKEEYRQIFNYDYLVVNDKVSSATEEIIAILIAEGCRTKHRIHLIEGVINYDALSCDE